MKQSIINKLTEDHNSYWVHKMDNLRALVYKYISIFFVRIIAAYRYIIIGKKCEFIGLPHFRRYPFSTIKIGNNCTFRSDQASNLIGVNHKCILSTHFKEARISIGNNCGFSGVTIGAALEITIGNNVLCGANAVITDFDWHTSISKTVPAPILIHDNVWIGLNTVILKGVEIGENTIIGANSVVLSNIPANVIAGGFPCKVLKPLNS